MRRGGIESRVERDNAQVRIEGAVNSSEQENHPNLLSREAISKRVKELMAFTDKPLVITCIEDTITLLGHTYNTTTTKVSLNGFVVAKRIEYEPGLDEDFAENERKPTVTEGVYGRKGDNRFIAEYTGYEVDGESMDPNFCTYRCGIGSSYVLANPSTSENPCAIEVQWEIADVLGIEY